jgi:penicillin-binding protein 2
MKRSIIAAILLVGMVHSAASLLAQTSTTRSTAKKKAKKKSRIRPAPPVDPTEGDNVDGDDLEIRRAAVAAIGTMNGSVLVADPTSGRILAMVNQKLSLKSGFIPCSTIKLVTALAALSEHVVTREEMVPIARRVSYNLTTALAHSNNQYFGVLGTRLGFSRVEHYAQLLGLGDKAGLDIPGEQSGAIPAEPPRGGGMGMMTAYGEGFLVTPLELAGLLSAIANGGTVYYLQYPRTHEEIENFTPKVKRTLDLSASDLEDVKTGMKGAVDFGTARRANYDPNEPILGKTGTCTDFPTANHMGWFGSFNEVARHQLVVAVMLAGTKTFNGPVAAGVAGAVYRALSEERYFTADATPKKDSDLPEILTTYSCCR